MTSQSVTGKICSQGPRGYVEFPIEYTSTDGTESNATSDLTWTVTAQNLGEFLNGQTIVSGFVSAKTGISYCYVLRNGRCISTIPMTSRTSGATGSQDQRLSHNIVVIPGDVLRVLTYA